MSVVNLGEVVYRTMRVHGAARVESLLPTMLNLPIHFEEADRELALRAARIKGSHSLAFGDCFAAALAQRHGCPVVTGDREFRKIEHLVAVEWLPNRERS